MNSPVRILCLILFLSVNISIAQKLITRFEHLSLNQGLSQASVNEIIQDKEGFIWIATQDGLNKFDGYKFTIYRYNQNNKQSLSYNYVYTIFEDSDGYLWVGTDKGGINRFDKKSEKFISFKNNPTNPKSILCNTIKAICEDKSGNLWIGSHKGLSKLPAKYRNAQYDSSNITLPEFKNYVYHPADSKSIAGYRVIALLCDKKGNLWIGTEKGLSLLKTTFINKKANFINFFNNPEDPASLSHNYIKHNSIFEDTWGNIWVGTKKGMNIYNSAKNNFKRISSFKNVSVTAIMQENDNTFWIGASDKLIRYNSATKSLRTYKNDLLEYNSIKSNSISSIIKDKGGNIWIGTYGGGINKLNFGYNQFSHYKINLPDLYLSQNSIWAIFEDSQNNLWIGTNGSGAICYNRKKGTRRVFNKNQLQPIAGNRVLEIEEDSFGNIWLGTTSGVSKISIKKFSTRIINIYSDKNSPNSLSSNSIRKIYEDKNKNIWIGTWGNGLNKLSAENNKINNHKFNVIKNNGNGEISNNYIRDVLESSDGSLWVTTYLGLNIFKNTRTLENPVKIFQNPGQTRSLTSNSLFLIHEDTKKNIWIGTRNGINKLTANQIRKISLVKASFKHFRENDGLANEIIYGLLEDKNGKIWVSTNKGISRIDNKTGQINNYFQEDGLQSSEYNLGAYFKAKDGSFYFGGINGYTKFYPDSIKTYKYSPAVFITDFLLYNKSVKIGKESVLKKHINFTKEITLNYTDHIFALEFSALNFRQPKKIKYAYKLEGLHQKWIETDHLNRKATFTDLVPGQYIFKVKACNDDDVWGNNETQIKITILPPLWLAWWARVIYGLMIIGGIYFFYSVEKKKYKQKKRELFLEKQLSVKLEEYSKTLEHKVEERTHELKEAKIQAEQANDLKTELLGIAAHDLKNPLNVILGFSDLIQDDVPENSESIKYLEAIKKSSDDMLDIISKLLNSAAIETGEIKLELDSVSLNQLLQSVIDEYIPLAANKQQKLSVGYPDKVIYIYADAGCIKEVISNIVSNAVKYSFCNSNIKINYYYKNNNAFIEVIDKGPGISVTEQKKLFQKFQKLSAVPTGGESSTGLGLSIAKKLIELHNGNIEVKTEKGTGSTFTIILPVKKLVKKEDIKTDLAFEKTNFMKQKIIIADDVRGNRKLISEILKKHNLTIFEVSNGKELIKIALKINPDFIFCDISMPVMDGFETIKILKSDNRLNNIPVAAVTSYKTVNVKKANFDEFVFKPVNENLLIEILKKHLSYNTLGSSIQKKTETDLAKEFSKLNKSELLNFNSKLNRADSTQIIDDVLTMAELLINISEKKQLPLLGKFASNLKKYCNAIDVFNIDKCLKQLLEISEKSGTPV